MNPIATITGPFAKGSRNGEHMVSVWGNAMSITEHRPETYAKDLTLCYPIVIPFSGSKLTLTFDNYCGTEPVSIHKIALLTENGIYPLTVEGAPSCEIGAGDHARTDPLDLPLRAGERVEVRFYLKEFTQMRSSVIATGPLSEGRFAVGDHTGSREIPIEVSRKTNCFYFLSNLSLRSDDASTHTVICYGDSITAQDWPDYLNQKCFALGHSHTAVIRRATSGSRILRKYDNITYESYGLKGERRFLHEVPTDGADTVIIQQGINDIIHPVGIEINPFRPMSDLPTAEELIDGLKWYIKKAREMGYRVYLGTLLPIEGWRTYAPFRDELRNAYNDWIRQTDLADGVIDFDLALRDPSHPARFLPEYDSGDHLHPSAEGYKRMAKEVLDAAPELFY